MTTTTTVPCTRRNVEGQRWTGCKCPDCARLNKASAGRRDSGKEVGVPLAAAWAAYDKIVAAGIGPVQLAEESGIDRHTVMEIGRDVSRGLRRNLAHATRLRLVRYAARPDLTPAWLPTVGASRRLQALAARGWSLRALSDECGIPMNTLSDLRLGLYSRAMATTVHAVADLYDRLWDKPPTGSNASVGLTIAMAKRNHWAVPLAWDDEDLDDPDAQPWAEEDYWPVCWTCHGFGRLPGAGWRPPFALSDDQFSVLCRGCRGTGRRRPAPRNDLDVDEVELLAYAGNDWETLAARMGVDPKSLYTRLHRRAAGEDRERSLQAVRLLRRITLNGIRDAQDEAAAARYGAAS